MSLGCSSFESLKAYHMFFNTYKKFMLGIFETAPFTDDAMEQIEKALKASFGKHKSSKTIAPTHAWLSNDPTQTAQKAENSIKQGGELVDSIHCGHAYLKEIGHFLRIEVAAKCGFDSFDLGLAGKAKKMNADSADGRWWVGYSAK